MDSQLRKDFFVLLDGHCEMLDELDNPFPAGLILITPAGVSTCGIEIYLVFSLMWAFYDQTFAQLIKIAQEKLDEMPQSLKNELEELSKNQNGL